MALRMLVVAVGAEGDDERVGVPFDELAASREESRLAGLER